jgi:hypothetical protein
VLAVTENGESICRGPLDPAWWERVWAEDTSKSFLFTLKNHPGIGPMKFPMKGSDLCAAYKQRDWSWYFGSGDVACRGLSQRPAQARD